MDGIENARIRSTSLGNDDHGFTFWLNLDFGSSEQGFGSYRIRMDDALNPRNRFGIHCIARILSVVGVKKWEDLPGHYVRARREGGLLRAIGPILGDPDYPKYYDWFEPGTEWEQFEPPKEEAEVGISNEG
jgi:hypothetical protein